MATILVPTYKERIPHMSKEIMERPSVNCAAMLPSRALVSLWRAQNAWDMAHAVTDEVTTEDYNKAYSLLNRCIRYSLAESNMDETETEYNVNDPRRKHKCDLLYKRYEKLNAELKPYGCRLHRQWCCTNVYEWDFERDAPKGSGLLKFY